MNAATLSKSAKGLILASGLIATSTVMGYAQDTPIQLGAQGTPLALSSLYASAPTGMAALGGHTFDLTSGDLLQLGNGQSATFTGSWAKPKAAYLLLNSYNTYLWYDQTVIGTVTITFADGTTQSADLMVGGNIREWRIGAGFTVNTLTDPAAAQVWSGAAAADGSEATIDMLTISLPATQNVTSITLTDTNTWGALMIDLAGLTLDTQDPQPAPAPDPQCIRPGNSCNTPAVDNSQADKWQSTTIPMPSATPTSSGKHANNGKAPKSH